MSDKTNPVPSARPAGAADPMAPLAGLAEMSAIGMGVAGQAFGLWLGSVSNALSLSQRMMAPIFDQMPLGADAFRDASRTAGMRAGAAVGELVADAAVTEKKPAEAATDASAEGEAVAAGAPVEAVAAPVVAVQPAAMARPGTPDDLKAIAGVGPKLEQVLNGFGLWTHAQIAALTEGEIAWLEEAVGFKGRIERDGWVGQAAALVMTSERS